MSQSTAPNILFIINGLGFSLNTGIGGSDKRAIELIASAAKLYPQSKFDILTTSSGYRLFSSNQSLKTHYYCLKPPWWWSHKLSSTLLGRLISYFYCTCKSMPLILRLKNYDVIFATSDFFFDCFPAIVAKIFNHQKIVVMVHHYIASPFKRKGGGFVNIFNFLSQQLSFILIKRYFDSVFLYQSAEGKHIYQLLNSRHSIKFHFTQNGIDPDFLDAAGHPTKIYQACFVGGIRLSKGIYDLLSIWNQVVKTFPQAKLALVGGGSQDIVQKYKDEIIKRQLNASIILTGPLNGQKTITTLKQSQIFLFPSYEEGWGIALHEALGCALPIVCYSLPGYSLFKKYIFSYPKGHWSDLATKTIKLLDSPPPQSFLNQSTNFARTFTWENITKKDLQFLTSL